jgi:cobyrinic acid a,c-diamide synthase
VGKTSVALGLAGALRRRGLTVQPFKVGPDFLDPTWLSLAAGRPAFNLDGWMTSRPYVEALFARAAADADVALIEGVMGLFDAANPTSLAGSTAEIAAWLETPVLLVVDAGGMAGSIAAMVKGYAEFAPGCRVAGVIANRCGSARHAELLARALAAAELPPLVGQLERDAFPPLPDRHLGLVAAELAGSAEEHLAALADACAAGIDLDAVLLDRGATGSRLAGHTTPSPERRGAVRVSRPTPLLCEEGLGVVRIGLARDEAFSFYYRDNLDLLAAAGVEWVEFSPLHDRHLPARLDGLYLGGGYPEEHAAELAANEAMRGAVRDFAAHGGRIYAECGGLMYLARDLVARDGASHAMAGLLPFGVRMLARFKTLGYAEVTTVEDGPWGAAGTRLRGHEFHYSEPADVPHVWPSPWRTLYAVQGRRDQAPRPEGFFDGTTLASYVHLHLGSNPDTAAALVRWWRADRANQPDIVSGAAIQQRSFDIIDGPLAARGFEPGVHAIVRRVVHATADFSFADSLRVHPEAVARGVAAIAGGAPLLCDARMLQAGMTSFGDRIHCVIDTPDVRQAAKRHGGTRAAAAMEQLADLFGGAIIAIGNAPTALFKVLELVAAGAPEPALVVGLPVGFVGAAESKEALLRSGLCYITNLGPRGGSPVAAAAVNALAALAKQGGGA